jgi:hypothetical protein
MGHVAAAVSIGSALMGGISAYRQGKAEQDMAEMKAGSALTLGDYNATSQLNESTGKVNSLQAQANIAESNSFKRLDANALKLQDSTQKALAEIADLKLKIGTNYSSYDYLKAVEQESFDKLTDYDYDTAMATQQASAQINEFDRKAKYQYSLGLAQADLTKYQANLQARGLRFQGELAKTRGQNALIGSVASAAGTYAMGYDKFGPTADAPGKGIFNIG